jgi:hypothetical protein
MAASMSGSEATLAARSDLPETRVATTAYDAGPADALAAVDAHRGPVLIDLDETLYLRNSTEDFIGHAWPSPVAFVLMKLLDLVAPWRLTGGASTRDTWRVAALSLLMPWALLTWRSAARRLAAEATNRPLADRLAACRQDKVIVTLGFRHVVTPLIEAMGLADVRVVSMSAWRFRDRREGKLVAANAMLGESAVCDALLITDSTDDLDLLRKCVRPLRVVWPEARYVAAFSDTYIPGLYLARVKRPGMKYIQRAIVRDDLAIWFLASVALAADPLTHAAVLALLALSFWATYECGYVDNDRIGAKYEKDPTLTKAFYENPVRVSTVQAWIWAAVAGAAGLLMLRWPAWPSAWDVTAWSGVLLVTFLTFRLYNRSDKQSRIWLFAVLQLMRAAAFVVVVPVTTIGMIAVCAHALARWVPYYLLRVTGTKWRNGEFASTRLLFFIVLSLMFAVNLGWSLLWSLTAAALLGWFLFKGRKELVQIYRNAHRITTGARRPGDGGVD